MLPYTQSDDAQPNGRSITSNNTNNTQLTTGLRTKNPLSDFSSYTYNITLYITTPEGMSYFTENDELPLDKNQYFVVAKSGGLSNNDNRALTFDGKLLPTGPGLDYYIEDLKFEMVAPAGNLPTVPTKFEFKIVEPLGFTFLERLAIAANEINSLSRIIQKSELSPNLFAQHYILEIKFYGYDENGELVSHSNLNVKDKNLKRANTIDSFRKLYPIIISKAAFNLDGKAVTYNMEGVILPFQVATGEKFGLIKKKTSVVASTVGEALIGSENSSSRSVLQIINDNQTDEKDANKISKKTEYIIEFEDDEIKNATLLDDNEYSSITAPMSSAKTTQESNIRQSVTAVTVNNRKKEISINEGTPIISVIDNIISKSNYVTSKLLSVNNQRIETITNSKNGKTELVWFTVKTIAFPIDVDPDTRGFVYRVIYRIQKHYIPYLRSLYKNKTTQYYGSHKEYEYIFTGQNTEIISYTQAFNTLFYVVQDESITADNPNKSAVDPAVQIYPQPSVNSSRDYDKQNRGSNINSNVRIQVNNVADLAVATIKINGDPDYLAQGLTSRINPGSEFFNKLYGTDGFSINPYDGQIFFEIIFRTAEDYQNAGLLDVNDQIKFYSSFERARKLGIRGVVYRLTKLTNFFNKGTFIQEIEGVIVSEHELGFNIENSVDQRETGQTTDSAQESRSRGLGRIVAPANDSAQDPRSRGLNQSAETSESYRGQDIRLFEGRQLPALSSSEQFVQKERQLQLNSPQVRDTIAFSRIRFPDVNQ